MKTATIRSIFTSVLLLAAQFLAAAQATPTDAEIKTILQTRIEKEKKSIGMVVGYVDEHQTKVIGCGKAEKGGTREPDGDTIFEIGSITKLFTTLLLENMVERGEMALDDPVQKFLPPEVKMPERDGKAITLRHLATHTSGLPRMPGNFSQRARVDPKVKYTLRQLYWFLSHYELPRDPGEKFEYSNLGMGLLGDVIALKAKTNYEDLVLEKICRPLRLESTRFVLTPEMKKRLATGYDTNGEPATLQVIKPLAAGGALRSTVNDLLKFASANLGLTESKLTPTMEKTQDIQFRFTEPPVNIALGWHVLRRFGTELTWKNGTTGGYCSFIGLDRKNRRAVVVLSNTHANIDDIGRHLLDSRFKLAEGGELKAKQN